MTLFILTSTDSLVLTMLWSVSRNKYTKYYSIVNLFKAVSHPIWWFFNFLLSTVGYLSSTCWCTKSFIHAPGQSKYCIMSETKKHCWDGWVMAQSWESHKELNKIKLHGRVQLLVQFESSGCLSKLILYSGKLSREKTFANWLLLPRQRTPHPKFRREKFRV